MNNLTPVCNYRMRMKESVPRSKLESLSSTRPVPLVQERYELKEVGWREDSDADNKSAEKECLLVEEEGELLCIYSGILH